MPTWCFKAAAKPAPGAFPRWYWQIDTNHSMIAITSNELFPTLEECIANARQNGFLGRVDVPADIDESSVITCQEGNYVHAIVHRSVQGRANRQLS
jgi:hypothetical protein